MIRVMCGKSEAGAVEVEGHPGIFTREFAHGKVVWMREMNGYNDSDFYATYLDGDEFKEVMYASTRGWSYAAHADIDATPEVLGRWEEYHRLAACQEQIGRQLREERTPRVGKRVKVVKGRKVPLNTEWWVVSEESRTYSHYQSRYGVPTVRLGLRSDDGQHAWTASSNVEVIAV
jgi:hypothetical protein